MRILLVILVFLTSFVCFSQTENHIQCRDLILQTPVEKSNWVQFGSWGPPATTFPKMILPELAKADWVVIVAKHFIGVPYRHKHIPQLGIDCSNFTSFVYNYSLGIKIVSNAIKQSEIFKNKIYGIKKLKKGDLIFFKRPKGKVSHVAIYIDENTLIDSTSSDTTGGVQVREFKGWYLKQFAFGGRLIR